MSKKNSQPPQPAAPTAAIQTASQPSPLEQRRIDYLTKLDKWANGELGPIDVRNMPTGGVGMSLYKDALQARDEGRLGKGIATLSEEGANKSFSEALDKQNQLERGLAASGQLEGYVDDSLAAKDQEMYGYSQMANARNMDIANLQSQNYWNYWNYRNSRPMGFWKQFGIGLASGSFPGALINKI